MNLLKKYFSLPKDLTGICDAVRAEARAQKVRIYLVGGIVRDMVLGKSNFDLDICVEGDAGLLAEATAKRLSVVAKKHVNFNTATLEGLAYSLDIAMCRKEIYLKPGALPTVESALIEEDLKRRDFTINALAMSLNEDDFGVVIDPYGGLNDLNQGLLRVLHKKSFIDDPTRLFRAIRFKERFNFSFERRTNRLIKEALLEGVFKTISYQRIREELFLIFEENKVMDCLRLAYRLTDFSFMPGVAVREKPDFTFLCHLLNDCQSLASCFDETEKIDKKLLLLLGLFEKSCCQEIEYIADNFALSKNYKRVLLESCDVDLKKLFRCKLPSDIYKVLERTSLEAIIFFYTKVNDKRLKGLIVDFCKRARKIKLQINGNHLKKAGIVQQKQYSQILQKVLSDKIDGKISTFEQEIETAMKSLSWM